MTATDDFGAFLRARRAQLQPEAVGLPSYGQRRVAGLRREEVAVLAGMNADYYTRLEQGRERHPSPQVLDAIGRALRLDDAACAHLHRIAGVTPGLRGNRSGDPVDPMLRQLLDSFPATPAFILNPALDLLAVNALAESLFSPFERADNLARMTFLDPVGRHFFARWAEAAESVAAALRRAVGIDPRDRRALELVDTLVAADADFADLWNSHIVRGKTFAIKDLRHPDVGVLTLAYHCFDVRGASGQELVVYHAEPGSPSVAALSLLGALGATRRQAASRPEKFRPDNSGVTKR